MSENPTQPQAQPVPTPPDPPVQQPMKPDENVDDKSVDLNPDDVDLNGETVYEGDTEDTASDEEGEPAQPQHDSLEGEPDGEPNFDVDEVDETEDKS